MSSRTLLNIGYGNLVAASRVIAIVAPGAAPMKRLRDEATKLNKLVDATQGRRTRSIILMDDDHVILSAINPETIAARFAAEESEAIDPSQGGEAERSGKGGFR